MNLNVVSLSILLGWSRKYATPRGPNRRAKAARSGVHCEGLKHIFMGHRLHLAITVFVVLSSANLYWVSSRKNSASLNSPTV